MIYKLNFCKNASRKFFETSRNMMPIRKLFCAVCLCAIILIILYLVDLSSRDIERAERPNHVNELVHSLAVSSDEHDKLRSSVEKTLPALAISFVLCGDRLQEALTLAKSAILFQLKYPLKLYIFADDEHKQSLEEKLSYWQVLRHHSFTFEILNLQFPKSMENEWKTLFRKCACQRLFIPDILQDVDAILYVDVDTLFLGPVYDVWKHFDLMNSTQMVALVNETDELRTGWYSRFARHPFYGATGLNSGVMLMNLTRMRQFGWGSYLSPIYKEYKTKIVFGDQDIINIIFYYHPENLYVLPCRCNFRTDHCRYMPACRSANEQGVVVLHGSRFSFRSTQVPTFSAIFQAFQEYQLGEDVYERILLTLEKSYLPETQKSPCGLNFKDVYLREIKKVFQPWGM